MRASRNVDAVDQIRFCVEPVPQDAGRGFEVQIFVNEAEMTRAGAGLGMDTNELLLPTNRFRPRAEPHRVAVARCGCGEYGCGSTDVLITSEDGVVHWDWLIEKPMNRRVTFDRADYLAEVDRLETDRSWETAERVVVRLVAQAVADLPLASNDLRYGFAGDYYADRTIFQVSLVLNDQYQIFVSFPWNDRTAEALATEIIATLKTEPRTWDAAWHGITPECREQPPAIAGSSWTQYRI